MDQWKPLTTAGQGWEARQEQAEEWVQEVVLMSWGLLNPIATLSMPKVLRFTAIKQTSPALRLMVKYSDHQTSLGLVELEPGTTKPILALQYREFLQAHPAARVAQLLILPPEIDQDQQDKFQAMEELQMSTQGQSPRLNTITCPQVQKAQLEHPNLM